MELLGLVSICKRFVFDTAFSVMDLPSGGLQSILVVSAFGLSFGVSAHGCCTFAWLMIDVLEGSGLAAVALQTGWPRPLLSPLALSGLLGPHVRCVCLLGDLDQRTFCSGCLLRRCCAFSSMRAAALWSPALGTGCIFCMPHVFTRCNPAHERRHHILVDIQTYSGNMATVCESFTSSTASTHCQAVQFQARTWLATCKTLQLQCAHVSICSTVCGHRRTSFILCNLSRILTDHTSIRRLHNSWDDTLHMPVAPVTVRECKITDGKADQHEAAVSCCGDPVPVNAGRSIHAARAGRASSAQ